MLDEYKQIYKDSADNISNWKSMNKNDLCNRYIDCVESGKIQESNYYLSAVIYKYWNTLEKYISGSSGFNSPEDTYEWVIQTILDTLDKKVWRVESHKLFGNPKGPTIAINQTLKSNKMLMFKAENRQKREINHKSGSLEDLQESLKDFGFPKEFDYYAPMDDTIISVVRDNFLHKEYFVSILIDLIVNFNCFKTFYQSGVRYIEFSQRNVAAYFHKINEGYLNRFSKVYDLPIEDVLKCKKYVDLPSQKIYDKLPTAISKIKRELYIGKKEFFYVN